MKKDLHYNYKVTGCQTVQYPAPVWTSCVLYTNTSGFPEHEQNREKDSNWPPLADRSEKLALWPSDPIIILEWSCVSDLHCLQCLSMVVHVCESQPIPVIACQCQSMSVRVCQFLSDFVNVYQCLSVSVNVFHVLLVPVNICQSLKCPTVSVNVCQVRLVPVNVCQTLSVSVSVCQCP